MGSKTRHRRTLRTAMIYGQGQFHAARARRHCCSEVQDPAAKWLTVAERRLRSRASPPQSCRQPSRPAIHEVNAREFCEVLCR